MVITIGIIVLNLQMMIFKIWLKRNKNSNNKIMIKNKVIYEKKYKLIIIKIL